MINDATVRIPIVSTRRKELEVVLQVLFKYDPNLKLTTKIKLQKALKKNKILSIFKSKGATMEESTPGKRKGSVFGASS